MGYHIVIILKYLFETFPKIQVKINVFNNILTCFCVKCSVLCVKIHVSFVTLASQ